jgi:uncharacterized membrane protein
MERFERFVEVGAPVERVFDMLSDFEGYPRWMGRVRAVWRGRRRTTHWVVETSLDVDVEWDAEVTVFEPDRRAVWRAVRGDVRADGEFVLAETREGATLVRFVLGYETPLGRTGEPAARFFGYHPGRQLEADLARFRRHAERAAEESRSRRRERREKLDGQRGGEESRPRHAMTPRERERDRDARRAAGEHRERARAGWYLRRGVDRLLDEPR